MKSEWGRMCKRLSRMQCWEQGRQCFRNQERGHMEDEPQGTLCQPPGTCSNISDHHLKVWGLHPGIQWPWFHAKTVTRPSSLSFLRQLASAPLHSDCLLPNLGLLSLYLGSSCITWQALAFLLVPSRPFCTLELLGGKRGFYNSNVQIIPQTNKIRMSGDVG